MSDSTLDIERNAAQPAEVSADGETAKQHSLRDQIEADRYIRAKHAARKPGRLPGVQFFRMRPPGAAE